MTEQGLSGGGSESYKEIIKRRTLQNTKKTPQDLLSESEKYRQDLEKRVLITSDNREIPIEALEELVLAGQSQSSLRIDEARVLGKRFSLPDCSDPRLIGSLPVLEWAKASKTSYEPSIIYCTWAAAGSNVDIEFIKGQLASFEKLGIHPDIFILDAWWFTAAGDWFSVDRRKFPSGLKEAAEMIRASGIEPWLWWGPYNVDRHSRLAQEHSDWLVQTNSEKPALFKFTQTTILPPHYILDPRQPEAQKYMQDVIGQFKKWGFEGVKADFMSNVFFISELDQLQALTYIHNLLAEIKNSGLGVEACGCPFTAALETDFVRVGNDSGIAAGGNSKVSRLINHFLSIGAERGVKQMTLLMKQFGRIPDPYMFYQFDLSKRDVGRLEEVQEYSIRNGGCLTLGDDFRSLTPEQLEKVRKLVSLFDTHNGKKKE